MENKENKAQENILWYVIHTYSSYENMVRTNLEHVIENNNLQDYIFEISIPTEEEIIEKNGKRKVVERKKFPGYVFIKMITQDHPAFNNVTYCVTNTRGVTHFVGPQAKPLPLTKEEVKRMGLEKMVETDFEIRKGDNIRVISGALENFVAVVDSVEFSKQMVRATVQMFGRPTVVDLTFNQIEKV